MTAFLSYEEVKQWRSSPEKISLEDYARRIGKLLPEKKETNDICDIINNNVSSVAVVEVENVKETEEVKEVKQVKAEKTEQQDFEINISFKKKLTPREETVFKYFTKNKGKTVFVKELAKVLGLPNNYVYKYIKNLREKLTQNILENDNNGGYILKA